ncbi:hypothetical protein [Bacillus toyonensis]|uniref:hypothetical protein n=1 Tax=Bacillus toyonensis TaxID=155322 RepID=UPI000BF72781|nr:hypothetical protein [Bacillus toyonensis]PGF04976.1 hypothetical protein COM61_00615 [Bacillus toyonensis]
MLQVQLKYYEGEKEPAYALLLDETGEQLAYLKSQAALDEFCKKTGLELGESTSISEYNISKEVTYKTNKSLQIHHTDDFTSVPKNAHQVRGTKGSSIVDMYLHTEEDTIHFTKPILLHDVKSYNKLEGDVITFTERHGSFYFVGKPRRRRKKRSTVR